MTELWPQHTLWCYLFCLKNVIQTTFSMESRIFGALLRLSPSNLVPRIPSLKGLTGLLRDFYLATTWDFSRVTGILLEYLWVKMLRATSLTNPWFLYIFWCFSPQATVPDVLTTRTVHLWTVHVTLFLIISECSPPFESLTYASRWSMELPSASAGITDQYPFSFEQPSQDLWYRSHLHRILFLSGMINSDRASTTLELQQTTILKKSPYRVIIYCTLTFGWELLILSMSLVCHFHPFKPPSQRSCWRLIYKNGARCWYELYFSIHRLY